MDSEITKIREIAKQKEKNYWNQSNILISSQNLFSLPFLQSHFCISFYRSSNVSLVEYTSHISQNTKSWCIYPSPFPFSDIPVSLLFLPWGNSLRTVSIIYNTWLSSHSPLSSRTHLTPHHRYDATRTPAAILYPFDALDPPYQRSQTISTSLFFPLTPHPPLLSSQGRTWHRDAPTPFEKPIRRRKLRYAKPTTRPALLILSTFSAKTHSSREADGHPDMRLRERSTGPRHG